MDLAIPLNVSEADAEEEARKLNHSMKLAEENKKTRKALREALQLLDEQAKLIVELRSRR
jgi:hypothetical protein